MNPQYNGIDLRTNERQYQVPLEMKLCNGSVVINSSLIINSLIYLSKLNRSKEDSSKAIEGHSSTKASPLLWFSRGPNEEEN